MLSDEEKQALKVVNKRTERLIEELKIEEEDLIDEPKIAYLIIQIGANKTLVNLIEKQSKEIEELKKHRQILNNVEFGKFPYDKNYQVKIEVGRQQGKAFRAGMEFSNKIWKDKIKAKIEEIDMTGEIGYLVKGILQSLLEKE